MAFNTPNNEVSLNSPSKIRGGAVQTAGALNVSAPNGGSNSGVDVGSIDAPALSGTPSYPRGGVSPSKPSRHTQRVMNTSKMKFLRRELRSHGTSAEGALWNMLKGKQIAGLQFRRQYSVGNHILDFYCPALKLAIELDGDYHYHMAQPDRDWKRDGELLEKYGIKTLRFENKIVFQHPESIHFAIMQELGVQNSPSKVRGGAVQTVEALKVTESNVDSSNVINSGSVDAPALTGTPSYPRGGVVDTPK